MPEIQSSGWDGPIRTHGDDIWYRRYFDHGRASATITIYDTRPISVTLGVDMATGRILRSFEYLTITSLEEATLLVEEAMPAFLETYPR